MKKKNAFSFLFLFNFYLSIFKKHSCTPSFSYKSIRTRRNKMATLLWHRL